MNVYPAVPRLASWVSLAEACMSFASSCGTCYFDLPLIFVCSLILAVCFSLGGCFFAVPEAEGSSNTCEAVPLEVTVEQAVPRRKALVIPHCNRLQGASRCSSKAA